MNRWFKWKNCAQSKQRVFIERCNHCTRLVTLRLEMVARWDPKALGFFALFSLFDFVAGSFCFLLHRFFFSFSPLSARVRPSSFCSASSHSFSTYYCTRSLSFVCWRTFDRGNEEPHFSLTTRNNKTYVVQRIALRTRSGEAREVEHCADRSPPRLVHPSPTRPSLLLLKHRQRSR